MHGILQWAEQELSKMLPNPAYRQWGTAGCLDKSKWGSPRNIGKTIDSVRYGFMNRN